MSSSASSLRGTASGDTGLESAWGEDEEVGEDEGMKEDEEMWMDDERVELQVRGEDKESSDAEEEEEDDKGGKYDEERERDGDDEGADDEGGAGPEASTTLWQPHVPHPRMKAWKGKGKATEKGKGK